MAGYFLHSSLDIASVAAAAILFMQLCIPRDEFTFVEYNSVYGRSLVFP